MDLVSIVITTKNEEKNIENCLKSIIYQSYKNIEIIVVDNNSIDKTKDIALKYTDKVYNYGPERSAQRNYGLIEGSNGKYLIYIDADMILSPDLIENALKYANENNFKALYISEIVLGRNFFSKVRRFERSFYDGTVIDGFRFFERETFLKTGGFDLNMSGPEDWDMDKKIKKLNVNYSLLPKSRLLNEDLLSKYQDWNNSFTNFIKINTLSNYIYSNVIYHNESEFDLKKYLNKKFYYSKSFDYYISKWGKNDKDIKKQFGILYRYVGVFIENFKFLKLLRHPFLTMGMYFLRFLVGIQFIRSKFQKKSI